MKKQLTIFTLLLSIMMAPSLTKAQDGFFSDARTLGKGTTALSIQPVFLTEQEDFMLIFRGAYGIQTGLTGHAKLGVFEDEIYFGGHIEGNIASEPNAGLSVAVLGGLYTYGELGLKTGINVSKYLDPISIYTGVNYQPLFLDGTTLHSVLVPVGLDIHLRNTEKVDLIFEADIPVNDDAQFLQALSLGARFYL